MCDLGLNVSGGMSPQRDDFSAKAAAYAISVGDLIRRELPQIAASDRVRPEHVSRTGLTDEIRFRRNQC
jgi:hypothetical protein